MHATFTISEEIPFFLRMWVKWHLRKYIQLMSKKVADIRDKAMRESIKITTPAAYAIEYKTEYTTQARHNFATEIGQLREKFLEDIDFIAYPPRAFPMSAWVCRSRLREKQRAIKKLEETIDRNPFLMINGYSVLALTPTGVTEESEGYDRQYKELVSDRDLLLEIYNVDIPNKIPSYKKAVKQLIKEL